MLVYVIFVSNCDVIMGAVASKSPASRLFTQPFIQTQIKENIKAPRHWWPVTGEFLAQIASNAENVSIWWCHYERDSSEIIQDDIHSSKRRGISLTNCSQIYLKQ